MKAFLHRMTALLTALLLLCLCTDVCGSGTAHPAQMQAAAAAAEIPGIDVSKFQETIDWQKVAADGIKFAIIRCCKVVHATGQKEFDNRFEENYNGAKAAGIAVGCYMWTDAATLTEFTQDTAFLLSHIEGKSFEFPVFLDVESAERQEHLSPSVFMPPLITALAQIELAGHTAGVYANTAFFSECLSREQLRKNNYYIWEANYFNTVNGLYSPAGYDLSGTASIWQYSGCGSASGIRTEVDRDICYTYQFFNHTAQLTDAALPSGAMELYTPFAVSGIVSANAVIRTVTGEICNAAGEVMQSVTVYPNAKSCQLGGYFSKKLVFSLLPAGEYTLRITAVDSSGKSISVAYAPFSVLPEETTTTTTTTTTETTTTTTETATETTVTETTVHSTAAWETTVTASETDTSTASSSVTETRITVAVPLRVSGMSSTFFVLRSALVFYDALGVRTAFSSAEETGRKLSLERTPLYRMVARANEKVQSCYLTVWVMLGLV